MDAIENLFVRAKHWQMFVLLFGLELAGYIGFIGILGLMDMMKLSSPSDLTLTVIEQVVGLPFTLCLLGWWWSMGSLLYRSVKPVRELNIRFFRLSFIPLVFLDLISPYYSTPNLLAVAALVPVVLLALSGLIYILFFVSKSVVIKTKGPTAHFGDDARIFFLLIFFPVGVWIIQPQINELYAEERFAKKFKSMVKQ